MNHPKEAVGVSGSGKGLQSSRRDLLRAATAAVVAAALSACGGGGGVNATIETLPDTVAPALSKITDQGGNAVVQHSQTKNYATSANLGADAIYTLVFDEKLGQNEYPISILGANKQPIAGITAVLKATDASKLTYTLTIKTDASLDFAGQPSKTVTLPLSVADVAGNQSQVTVEHTVNAIVPTFGEPVVTSNSNADTNKIVCDTSQTCTGTFTIRVTNGVSLSGATIEKIVKPNNLPLTIDNTVITDTQIAGNWLITENGQSNGDNAGTVQITIKLASGRTVDVSMSAKDML